MRSSFRGYLDLEQKSPNATERRICIRRRAQSEIEKEHKKGEIQRISTL